MVLLLIELCPTPAEVHHAAGAALSTEVAHVEQDEDDQDDPGSVEEENGVEEVTLVGGDRSPAVREIEVQVLGDDSVACHRSCEGVEVIDLLHLEPERGRLVRHVVLPGTGVG